MARDGDGAEWRGMRMGLSGEGRSGAGLDKVERAAWSGMRWRFHI